MDLIEVEVRDGLGLAGIEGGRLVQVGAGTGVEAELGLGWPRAGERGGGVVGRPRWRRMTSTGWAAVMKARIRISAPQPGQSIGNTS
jgi:hypothetical protein